MGIISDLMAIKDIQRLSRGERVKLSMSQITNAIINLPDANKNLSKNEYQKIVELYNKFRKCNTKLEMDKEGYYRTCIDIITEFDKIAPYEKYSGTNAFETSFLMKEVRKYKDEDLLNNKKESIKSERVNKRTSFDDWLRDNNPNRGKESEVTLGDLKSLLDKESKNSSDN